MPARNSDLHGNVPESCPVALLLIDVVNDLEFDGGDRLREHALPMAHRLRALRARAREQGVPVVYVNDNFGRWRSDFRGVVKHCIEDDTRGRELVEILQPGEDDYFVLKPKHSAFFATTLDTLLEYLGARTLVLTGLTGEQCVLFTASDAFMRDFHVVVAPDCTASRSERDNEGALRQMERLLRVELIPSHEIDFAALRARGEEEEGENGEDDDGGAGKGGTTDGGTAAAAAAR